MIEAIEKVGLKQVTPGSVTRLHKNVSKQFFTRLAKSVAVHNSCSNREGGYQLDTIIYFYILFQNNSAARPCDDKTNVPYPLSIGLPLFTLYKFFSIKQIMNAVNSHTGTPFIGNSDALGHVTRTLEALAEVPWPVMLRGPSGSGKTLAARYLHERSDRRQRPFVSCPMTLLGDGVELAELTGYAKGAFTGAIQDHMGAFEAAHGGTLFLDEIDAASPRVQRALLQLLEDRSVVRMGERRARRIDVRLVYATNADLGQRVLNGGFRNDLFYRLGALKVEMPPLAGRDDDIVALFNHYHKQKASEANKPALPLEQGDIDALTKYEWPGNVRELKNAVEHWVVFGYLPETVTGERDDWRRRVDEVLRYNSGNKAAAARSLGISRKTLYQELERKNKAG